MQGSIIHVAEKEQNWIFMDSPSKWRIEKKKIISPTKELIYGQKVVSSMKETIGKLVFSHNPQYINM